LAEHTWFREQFAALDELRGRKPAEVERLRAVWEPLGQRLDVHAVAEERIFYPQLLKVGDDPKDETLDAIADHNKIRDGVHEAGRHGVGTDAWWAAVDTAREENDEHMAEEEREGLADFRQHAPVGLREALGNLFTEFLNSHPTTTGLDVSAKDPDRYVSQVENKLGTADRDATPRAGESLGIGSLKGNLTR